MGGRQFLASERLHDIHGFCRPCHTKWFCATCNLPCQQSNPAECLACHDRLALWCRDCNDEAHIRSGLCDACHKKEAGCQFCHNKNVKLSESICKVEQCGRSIATCPACILPCQRGTREMCTTCWQRAGRNCVWCGTEHAQDPI